MCGNHALAIFWLKLRDTPPYGNDVALHDTPTVHFTLLGAALSKSACVHCCAQYMLGCGFLPM